jgi:hypothetical protein
MLVPTCAYSPSVRSTVRLPSFLVGVIAVALLSAVHGCGGSGAPTNASLSAGAESELDASPTATGGSGSAPDASAAGAAGFGAGTASSAGTEGAAAAGGGGAAGGSAGAAAGSSGAAGSTGAAGSSAAGGRWGAVASWGAAGSSGDGGSSGEGGSSGFVGNGHAGAGHLALAGEPCAGYTLVSSPENDAGPDATALLVDMAGNIVHRWPITGFPAKILPGGSLIGCGGVFPGSIDCIEMQQVTWTGELQWSFSDWVNPGQSDAASRQHHDFQRYGNPVGFYAPGQEVVPRGRTLVLAHAQTVAPEIREPGVDDDVIYEVTWDGTLTNFEWRGADHLDEFGLDEVAREDLRTRAQDTEYLDWLHGNTISRLGHNHWYDEGYDDLHPDHIMYSSRDANIVIIISHETGEVVWRIGPDVAGRPEESLGQFVGQHTPHMIPTGLPGEGNVLMFDNGGAAGFGGPSTGGSPNRFTRDYSRVVEFDPITFEIIWEYGSPSGPDFYFSAYTSSAQRLPNGNTLIAIGGDGRIIEVTPDKQVVWEYQYTAEGSWTTAQWVYRAYRVPPEWLPASENEAFGNYASWESLFED